MTDRTIRNLALLQRSASTARVLNLSKVHRDHGDTEAWADQPVFRTRALNRALIIKHRLRRDEIDLFPCRRHVATKIVIPIDANELRTGGRYTFVGQTGFEAAMREAFGLDHDHDDLRTLRLIDSLPSLDPFLLREQLRGGGIEAAPCYFAISDADLIRMVACVEREIMPLVMLSVGTDRQDAAQASAQRLAGKILSDASQDRMEALRETLRLEPDEYQEGIFCWKGFLYYKWVLTSLMAEVASVADAVWAVKPAGKPDKVARDYLDRGRTVLRNRIVRTCDQVGRTLRVYDDAYAGLTVSGQPTGFRDFLLDAPRMFSRLGDQLGAVQHIVSFWRFRFSPGHPPVGVDELVDIFMDFEAGLLGREETATGYDLAA